MNNKNSWIKTELVDKNILTETKVQKIKKIKTNEKENLLLKIAEKK